MTAVTSPATALRQRLIDLIGQEFAAEGIVADHDKLDDSRGWDGACAAVYPDEEEAFHDNRFAQNTRVIVQVFNHWDKEVDPKQRVNPSVIENLAERFKRKCQSGNSYLGDAHDWFFTVERIRYPDDPTGNKTRFTAEVTGWASNPTETTVSG